MSNNITRQVITELETIKAIASELADMSPRTQMEIVTLCKEICLNVDEVLKKHDIDITTLFNYVNTLESEMEEIRQLIDPQHLALIDERLENLEGAILSINESIGGINETLSTHTTQIQGLENDKQDVLTAGDNITIENNVISASGGGSELYEHNIRFRTSFGTTFGLSYMTLFTNNNTPLTYNDIAEILYNSKARIPLYGNTVYGDRTYITLYAYASTISTIVFYSLDASVQWQNYALSARATIIDTIRQI